MRGRDYIGYMLNRNRQCEGGGGVFEIYVEPESPNESSLRCTMIRNRQMRGPCLRDV